MKKLIFLFALTFVLFSCEKYNDQFEGYDENVISQVVSLEYTLTTEDYEEIGDNVAKYSSFSDESPAANLIPDLLAAKYPALDVTSAIKVTYNFKNSYPNLSEYTGATKYTLTEADYASASQVVEYAQYFSPKNPADDFIPAILNASIPDAQSGDNYIVSYMYSDIEPDVTAPQEITVFEYEFATSLGDFTSVNVLGDKDWYSSDYNGMGYAKMSGFTSGAASPNEDWLISPAIDLTGLVNSVVNVNQTAKYVYGEWDNMSILVSSDFDGTDPATATWTLLNPVNMPAGDDYTFVETGNMDISAFDGQMVYVALKYVSSDSNAATWEVNKVEVKGTGVAEKSGIIANAIAIDELYTYTSSWKKTEGAYYLTSVDYDAMGAPGSHNNFSSSTPAKSYLPQFAGIKYPYAEEGDEMVFVYKYYSSSAKETQVRGDKLNYKNGSWMMYDPIVVKTDQFIIAKSGDWVFDPAVNYTMKSDDYQIIVDYVKANIGAEYISSFGNNETYYGSNAYYVEFQIGSSYFDSSFATWQDAATEAIGKAFLPAKFPNAVAQVDGIDVNYIITFAGYLSAMVDYSITFQCTKSGPNPEFTYVEGPTVK